MTLSDAIKEVSRELKMREWMYPTWVSQGRMTREDCDQKIASWENVLRLLEHGEGDREAALQEIRREVEYRNRVYPRSIQSGKLNAETASRQMKRLYFARDWIAGDREPEAKQQSLF
jgi:hypothetical protein